MITIIKYTTYLISCLTKFSIIADYLKNTHTRKLRSSYYVLVYFTGTSLLTLISMYNISKLNIFFVMMFYTIIDIFMYYHDNKWYLISDISFLLLLVIVEEVSVMFLLKFNHINVNKADNIQMYLYATCLSTILTLMLYRFLLSFLTKIDMGMMRGSRKLIYILAPFLSIINILTIMHLVNDFISNFFCFLAVLSALGNVVCNIFLTDIMHFISNYKYTNMQIHILENHSSINFNYYKRLEENYLYSRQLLHDVKNHLITIERLYQDSRYDEANQYKEFIYDAIDTLGMKVYTLNHSLNIILNEKLSIANEQNIQTFLDIDDIDLNFISDFDTTIIFGNLLDNSIQACSYLEEEERVIYLKIKKIHDIIFFYIANPMKENYMEQKPVDYETKHQGLGLMNVRYSLEKYEASMDIFQENNQYKVQIRFVFCNEGQTGYA